MKNIAEQAEKIMHGLDRSQEELEEMAFELLNAVDHVSGHNGELYAMLELLAEADSEECRQEIIQGVNICAAKMARAMASLECLVHKNEEICSEQRKHVEEAKQAVDFLHASYDW